MPPKSLYQRFKGNPSRVFLAFSLGIVLPAGFLSYLGFRSFKTEEKLLRQQAEERPRAVADLLERRAEEILPKPLESLRQIAAEPSFKKDRVTLARRLMTLDDLDRVPLEARLAIDNQGRPIFPPPEGTARPAEQDMSWGAHAGELRRLEQLEFQAKRFDEAFAGYQALLKKPLTPPQQAWVLKCMAGLERKRGRDASAEALYQRLIKEFDSTPDASGDPIGLLSRLWLARLYDQRNQLERAERMRLEAAEGLLFRRWPQIARHQELTAEVFEALETSARHGFADASLASRWRELRDTRAALQGLQEFASAFLQKTWPGVLRDLRRRGWSDQGGIIRQNAGRADETWVVVAPLLTGDVRYGWLAAIVPADPYWSAAKKALGDITAAENLELSFDLLPPAQAQRLLQRSVGRFEPPVRFSLRERVENPQDELANRRLYIYGGMVGLSLLVILIGLVLMGQAMRREMEIAAIKSDFVAGVSHELRTPLAAISYIAERLNRGRYRSEEDVKELYAMLSQESGRLQELIEDVLNFAKTLTGPKIYRKEAVDLREVAHEAIDRLRGKAEAGGFTLRFDAPAEPLPVHADRRAAVQAVANLVDNAMKYSGDAREVRVGLRRDDGFGAVEVQDRGIGIPPEEQARIFDKFHRVHDGRTSGSPGGVGLGLAMVKHIMDGHAGKVTVDSELGNGSRFTLYFPRTSTGSL
jgi:signal transduction histidine kinase